MGQPEGLLCLDAGRVMAVVGPRGVCSRESSGATPSPLPACGQRAWG